MWNYLFSDDNILYIENPEDYQITARTNKWIQ